MDGAAVMTEWRPVSGGFEGFYEVAPDGRVRGVDRVVIRRNGVPQTVRGRVLRPHRHKPSGMWSVVLSREGRQYTRYLHRLVAEVWEEQDAAA
jgi:hypothetical protein